MSYVDIALRFVLVVCFFVLQGCFFGLILIPYKEFNKFNFVSKLFCVCYWIFIGVAWVLTNLAILEIIGVI